MPRHGTHPGKKPMKDTALLQKVESYDNKQIEEIIEKHINGKHAERNRTILKRRIIDGICYEPLAEEFDLSIRQTQNIVYKSINKLMRVL